MSLITRASCSFALVAMVLLAVSCSAGSSEQTPPSGSDATETKVVSTVETGTPVSIDSATYYATNCAVCHGADRAGVGRAGALTPDALVDEVDDYLDELDDRTHTAIWNRTGLDVTGRRALIEYLATTPP